jgi:hypothetical protein
MGRLEVEVQEVVIMKLQQIIADKDVQIHSLKEALRIPRRHYRVSHGAMAEEILAEKERLVQ